MRSCCVPGCNIRTTLHSVPYTKKLRWKQWLKLCPFLSKYTFPQLEYVKICRNHFIPEHIDFEKERLRKDSFPLLNLPDIKTNKTVNKGSKVLEIYPIESNESINFKVVPTGPEVQTENTFPPPKSPTEGSKETQQLKYLASLKAEDANGLPVDHNMYCLPLRADKQPTCLHSPLMSPHVECHMKAEPIAAKCTFIKTMKTLGAAPKDTVSVATQMDVVTEHLPSQQLPELIAAKCTFIKTMGKVGAAPRDTVSVATQTDSVTDHLPSQQIPDLMSAQNEHSLIKDLKTKTVELLSESHSITLDNSDYDDNVTQDNVYIVPPDIVADMSAHRDSQEQLSTYLCPLTTSKLPPKRIVSLNDPCILPHDHVCSMMKPTATILQPSQRAGAQVQTLESLVSELMESVNAEETAESQPSPTDTPACLLNPTSDTAPCPPTKESPVRKHPALTSDTEIRRVGTGKENSTPNEQMLRMQNKMLKTKLKSANQRCKNLRSKLDGILGIAKPFLKAYPYLTQEMKALIDTQVRLAGVPSRAARYHEDEKLFAFRLYQMSPDCYRFLQQYLKLPSKNTMQAIIKNV